MKEKNAWVFNGYLVFLIFIVLLGTGIFMLTQQNFVGTVPIVASILLLTGIQVVQPNRAYVVTFFGSYMGTIRKPGFWFTFPLSLRKAISLRVRNFNSKTLKVNDTEGNPIEIAAVIVFRVVDTAKSIFDVDKYEQFVEIQSETALRHVASHYPYDTFESNESAYSLRANGEEIAQELAHELQQRLTIAGVEVIEARLTHLAYSTEIAGAMLQRQQANAILAARQIIVDGAMGMVQIAIEKLDQEKVVHLDDERKAAMINNLLVAIVSDRSAQPVINTGSLY